MPIRWHVDDPALLAEAIRFTAARTGFQPALIEKDYFASVVLEYLAASHDELAFKGGTSLSKIHVGFYRLSEDLDFTISMPVDASRADRRRAGERLRAVVTGLPKALPEFQIGDPLRAYNESTQYNGTVSYRSLIDDRDEPVSIEVGLREPLINKAVAGPARTLVLNPLTNSPLVDEWPVLSLSRNEAIAEKFRAAMCRREIAIRDFFDVDHLVQKDGLDPTDEALLKLVKRKIAVAGTGPVNLSDERVRQLAGQLEGRLRPVLREREFAEFELARAVDVVRTVADAMGRR